jgi:hypothetical protein
MKYTDVNDFYSSTRIYAIKKSDQQAKKAFLLWQQQHQ